VLYELHVGTFTPAGTFDGAIERLDHLVDLGVDAVELLPVAEFMGDRGWGYDGVDLWAPHHVYGGPDGLRRLVDACHRRGLGVVLDVVYNHLGPRGNHLARFGPYFTDEAETPWGDAVRLAETEVRRFVLDNAHHWFVDHHVDGLRLDATHALVDPSPRHVLAKLSAMTESLRVELGRPLWLVAEREQEEALPVLPRDEGGWGLDARWSDDLHHAIHAAVTGERDGYYADFGGGLADVATALTAGHVRPGDTDGLPPGASVVCLQNHDQIGNRAKGERIAHLVGPDAAVAAAALVLCSPATVLLFQGEEWAASSPFPYFCDPPDAELAAAVTEGRRAEFAAFGWGPDDVPDPVAVATFESAVLRWDERDDEPHAGVLATYRSLLQLRRKVAGEPLAVEVDEDRRVVVLRRGGVVVTADFGAHPGVTVEVAG
jgi:maltooligosyltrehalose trehalohydrolase